MQKIMIELVPDDIKAIAGGREQKTTPTEGIVQFVRGGLFGLAMLWATRRLSLSVDEINSLFSPLAMPEVKASQR